MNCDCEVFILLIVNLIEKKEDEIISHKNCEINTQLFSSSNLLNLTLKKNTDIQNLNLFTCIIFKKHTKNSSKMTSSFIMLIKKFVIIISRFFNFNFL